LTLKELSLVEASQELLQELLRRLHQRIDKSDQKARDLRNELNAMRLTLQAHHSDLNNLYTLHHQHDERLDRIENRLELREFQEAQARFEPQP
jgi:flagellar biosynthesis chaperone FliJ